MDAIEAAKVIKPFKDKVERIRDLANNFVQAIEKDESSSRTAVRFMAAIVSELERDPIYAASIIQFLFQFIMASEFSRTTFQNKGAKK